MSFSVKVKSEILRLQSERTEKISLLSSYIRNNAVITEKSILINTENMEISKYIFELFKELYNIFPIITVRKSFNFKKSMSYLLKIDSHLSLILKDLSLINEDGYFINIPREYIYTEDDDKMSYLRGVFLATGSINDPKTSRYHLEFLIDDYDYSLFVCELLDYFNLNSKLIERNNGFMIYIKEAEKISDFLRIMKAYNAVLYFEDIKAYREHKNLVNRLNNCEQANVEKTINSALNQVSDIELIENKINIEYKLKLNNKKTVISNSNQGISFLGYTFRVKDNKTIIKLSSNTKKNIRKGIKRANYLYRNNIIKFNQYFSSIECFKNNYIFVNKDKVFHFIDRYNG